MVATVPSVPQLPEECVRDIDKFIVSVKRKHQCDDGGAGPASTDVAREVAEILRRVLGQTPRGTDFGTMLRVAREAGRRLMDATPFHHVAANVTRRVLYIMRHEYQETKREQREGRGDGTGRSPPVAPADGDGGQDGGDAPPRLHLSPGRGAQSYRNPALDARLVPSSVTAHGAGEADDAPPNWGRFKNNLMEHLANNFINEFEGVHRSIAKQALDHIAEGDVLLTYGRSVTVERFLLHAAAERKGRRLRFEVYVCEAAPGCGGHQLAAALHDAGVRTTLVPDSAAYAVMSRISKVVVGTHVVLADGSLVAPAGTRGVAVAASMHSVPVVVCTSLIKLSPQYPPATRLADFGGLRDPGEVLTFDEVTASAGTQQFLDPAAPELRLVTVTNARVDYVAPDLVALFVTDKGETEGGGRSYAPSYVYRLLQQLYNPEDNVI